VLLERILQERRRRWEEAELAKMKAKGKLPKNNQWKAKYKEPAPPDTSNLPELPEGWCWATIEQVGALKRHALSSGPFGSSLGTKDYRDQGVPVIRGQNVLEMEFSQERFVFVSPSKAEELERSVAYPGDIVVVAVGASGRAAVIPGSLPRAVLSQNCNKISLNTDVAYHGFIAFALQVGITKAQMASETTDTVRKFLSLTNLRRTVVPLPPLKEQHRIFAEVQRQDSLHRRVDAGGGIARARCQRLRQSILKWAFEGKLVDQDPNDEPAEVLLERIKTEREASETTKKTRKPRGRRNNTTS
jgi:type I restriction enzyme S subunit